MDKFTISEKENVVRLVLEEHYSFLKAGNTIGASKNTVMGWVNLVKYHGYDALHKNQRTTFSGEFKLEVVEYMMKNKASSYTAAAHFGINRNQAVRWQKIFVEEGAESLMNERRGKHRVKKPRTDPNADKDILKELDYLRMENEYLKKLNALVQQRVKQEEMKK